MIAAAATKTRGRTARLCCRTAETGEHSRPFKRQLGDMNMDNLSSILSLQAGAIVCLLVVVVFQLQQVLQRLAAFAKSKDKASPSSET